jgi:serine/threonine-protein kinase
MPPLLRCPNGHEWANVPNPAGAAVGRTCPVCGVAAAPSAANTDDEAATILPSNVALTPTASLPPVAAAEPIAFPPLADPAQPPVRVPGYEIVGELGRGGMGVVYQARQTQLGRTVALKMILAGGHAGTEELERFRTEALAFARLQHPNIVQIYEVGQHAGLPYFSLEYCAGGSLTQKLRGTPLPPLQAAALVATLAVAMHAAHQKGVIHRDLKPGNVLLAEDGTPKITDFGLAKKVDAEVGGEPGVLAPGSLTATGAVMGTPSYMAPEQAGGKKKSIGPACDVYALGAILYECLTGRPPFRAATRLETIMQVVHQEPAPPRLLNPNIDRDLETICLKCLEKDPQGRYPSAAALADDLERYGAGESITARSTNLLDRLARTLKRSSSDVEFHSWGTLLLWSGAILFACHTAYFVALQLGLPIWLRWVSGTIQFGLIGLAFWRNRPATLLPTTAAERQLWSIWIGYLLAFAVSVLIQEVSAALASANRPVEERMAASPWSLYPFSAVLSGLAFFVMGSSYWGGFYAVGLGFFVLAALMPFRLDLAPLEFALFWSATLVLVGVRLRRLNAADGRESQRNEITSN